MKNLTFLFACILGVFLFSCERSEELGYPENKTYETAESYVYRERDPNSPLILSIPRERLATRATELQFDDLLGRSFKLDYFPFQSMQNVGEPVINLMKLEEEHPQWITKLPMHQSISTAFSYSTFDRYEKNSSSTTTVDAGFKLNFGIFSIGNKNTYYNYFTSSLITSSKSVFGQLDIVIKDAIYNLAVNSNRLNQLRKDYLENDFIDDLYNLPPYEFYSFYGPFLMTNFITGGRATALFAGITKTTETEEARERTMDSEISGSFSFKNSSDNTASLGFGKGFTNGSSSTNTFTQLEATLTTLGGTYGLGAFTTPRSIDNMDIDLTAWVNSLNHTDNHALVDIENNGLTPLLGLFVEANFKAQYERYVAGDDLPLKQLVEPKLVHMFVPRHPMGAILSNMYLITRFGDAIIVHEDIMPLTNGAGIAQISKKQEAIFDELCDIYKIKAELWVKDTNFNSEVLIADYVLDDKAYRTGVFLETKMKKYYDVDQKMLYIVYNENGKKVGYSIYMGKGDYLLDTYGIRQWVNTLPTTTVTDNELLNYTLIAL